MRVFISVGLGVAVGFLVSSLGHESSCLFQFADVMTATKQNTMTARGSSEFSPPACTADQLDFTFQRLAPPPQAGEVPIRVLTRCPHATWLEDYYVSRHDQNPNQTPFLAINVGCNKGYDAVDILRMGTYNPAISRKVWKDALPPGISAGVCGQDEELSTASASPSSFLRGSDPTIALVYCIEPLPSTFLALQDASRIAGWDNQFKVLRIAMNNGDPSTVLFPKPEQVAAGVEWIGISNMCGGGDSDKCTPVETKRLDLMMSEEQLTEKRVNVLLIDVEGFDFEVLKGAHATLRNTEYVSFELNAVGQVRVFLRSFWLCSCHKALRS
jgi:FkbM family methyltransferase